jgi:beta-N-acetylhexosaminidase
MIRPVSLFLGILCIFCLCCVGGVIYLLIPVLGTLNKAEPTKQIAAALPSTHDKALAEKYIQNLSLREKISQLFLVNLSGDTQFAPVEFDHNKTPLIPGGYLFFSYNIAGTYEEVTDFTKSIRNFCLEQHLIPPFLSIDHEGGTVNRLRKLTGPLPSALEVAQTMPPDEAVLFYCSQGEQLVALGFHLNLAPVAETENPENTEFLHGRSFGSQEATVRFGAAAINGYRQGGIQTAIKHFPGNTNVDPHSGFSEITASTEELKTRYIAPFRALCALHPAAVLMSHARTAAQDPGIPACLSYFWVTQTLRNDLGFEGLIISDDIYMKVLGDNGFPPEVAAVQAIESGIDVIMISEKRFLPLLDVLAEKAEAEPEFAQKIHRAATRVLLFKAVCGILESPNIRSGDGL